MRANGAAQVGTGQGRRNSRSRYVESRRPLGSRRDATALTVEFLGLPGSGKTTLARSIANKLEQHGYHALMPLPEAPTRTAHAYAIAHKLFNIPYYLLSAPKEALKVLSMARIVPPQGFLSHLRVLQYLVYLYGIFHRYERRCDILLLDQGFAQAVYTLALQSRADDSETLAAILSTMRRPHILIKLNVDADVVIARLAQRRHPQSRLQRLIQRDGQAIRRSTELIDRIEGLSQQFGWKIIHHRPLPTTPISDQADTLTSAIEGAFVAQTVSRFRSGEPRTDAR